MKKEMDTLTRDSYEEFFKLFKSDNRENIIKKFLLFGLENSLFVHPIYVKEQFKSICEFVFDHDHHKTWMRIPCRKKNWDVKGKLFIRKENNDELGEAFEQAYRNLYKLEKEALKREDNQPPRNLIRSYTGNSDKNYQCSHVFERSLNILAYMALWNFALTPKLIDPLTGHETNGEMSILFQVLFQGVATKIYEDCISLYNKNIQRLRSDAKKNNIDNSTAQWADIVYVEFSNPNAAKEIMGKYIDISHGVDKICINDAYEAICKKYLNKDPNFRIIGVQNKGSLDCADIEKEQKMWLQAHPDIVMIKFDNLL